jgi:5'-nucleotidase
MLRSLHASPIPPATILNVNVPDVPLEALAGFRVTRLGQRHRSEPVVRDRDPRGREIFWVGPAGPGQDAGPGTDFHAIAEGCVSITPLHVDLTRYAAIQDLSRWLDGLKTP